MPSTAVLTRIVVRNATDIFGGPLHGTEYSLGGACPRCGTGAEQTGPLVLSRFKAPKKDVFSTLNDEILISPRFSDALRARGIQCVRQVLDAESKAPLPVLQLVADVVLPPFAASTTGYVRERACELCKRDGYFGIPHVPMALWYDALPSGLVEKDLLATFERFGNSRLRTPFRDSVFAAPVYLAGARLANELKQVKGVDFERVDVS